MGDFAVAVEDVDGNENNAGLDAGEEEINHLDAIAEIDAEAVAGLKAGAQEEVAQLIASFVKLLEGIGLVFEFKSDRAGMIALRRKVEKIGEIHRFMNARHHFAQGSLATRSNLA